MVSCRSELAARVDLLLTHSVGFHGALHAVCRIGGHHRATGYGGGDGGGIPASAGRDRRGTESDRWFHLSETARCLLCISEYQGTGMKSNELANLLLEKAGVALLPGSSFGEYGEGYLRLSYANSIQNIQKGMGQIKSVLG